MTQIGVVAVILVGATVGAGDRGAGVFGELVVTGRPRLALFAARIPGGLTFLLPLVAVGFTIAAVAAVALTGDDQSPIAGHGRRRQLARSAGIDTVRSTVVVATRPNRATWMRLWSTRHRKTEIESRDDVKVR